MAFGQSEEYWRLQGSLSIGDRNLSTGDLAATGLRSLGDASELGFSPTEQFAEHREHQSGKGYKDLKLPISTDVPINITLDNLGKNNFRDFLKSTATEIAGGSVTAEAHTAPAAGNSFLLASAVAGTVTLTASSGGTAYTVETDYIQDGSQIFVPTGSTMAGASILAAYTKGAASEIDLFAASHKEYYLYFNGVNTFNNKKITLRLWKVCFSIGSLSALISDQITTMQIQGEALHETLKTNVSNLGGYGLYHYQS